MSTANFTEAETVVANAPVGVMVARNRLVVRCNHKFSELFGFVGGEGIGQRVSGLFQSPAAGEALAALADSLLAAAEPLRSEDFMQRLDGTVFPATIIGYALDPENLGEGTVWIVDDLARHRKAAAKAAAKAAMGPALPADGIGPGDRGFAGSRRMFPLVHRDGMCHEAFAGSAAVAAADPLFAVPGLDAVAGLRRAGGKMDFYRKLLRQFLDSQSWAARDISVALAAANFRLAARLAHALKGCSGNLGATQLAQLAAEVDDVIREQGNGKGTRLCLMRLDAALDGFCTALAAALGIPAARDGSAICSGQIVAELAARLHGSDGEVADYFEAHADVLRETLPGSDFAALATAVLNYDFAAALARLGALPGGRRRGRL